MARQRAGGGANPPRKRGSRRGGGRGDRGGRGGKPQGRKPEAPYYTQPGKRGAVVVLHRPVGNRVSPKVCGIMPSAKHAKALVDQLRRAESALHDLFYEATDDGIEALEAVLAACREAVLSRMPLTGDNVPSVDEMAAERVRLQSELDGLATAQRAG